MYFEGMAILSHHWDDTKALLGTKIDRSTRYPFLPPPQSLPIKIVIVLKSLGQFRRLKVEPEG